MRAVHTCFAPECKMIADLFCKVNERSQAEPSRILRNSLSARDLSAVKRSRTQHTLSMPRKSQLVGGAVVQVKFRCCQWFDGENWSHIFRQLRQILRHVFVYERSGATVALGNIDTSIDMRALNTSATSSARRTTLDFPCKSRTHGGLSRRHRSFEASPDILKG